MQQATQAALDRLVGEIVEAVHPLRIILFGSAARGDAGPESDLDVLVVMPDGTHGRRTAMHIHERVEDVGLAFDVVVSTPALLERQRRDPGLIYGTILDEGRTVYAA